MKVLLGSLSDNYKAPSLPSLPNENTTLAGYALTDDFLSHNGGVCLGTLYTCNSSNVKIVFHINWLSNTKVKIDDVVYYLTRLNELGFDFKLIQYSPSKFYVEYQGNLFQDKEYKTNIINGTKVCLVRYIYGSTYNNVLSRALDIEKNTSYNMFEAIQLSLICDIYTDSDYNGYYSLLPALSKTSYITIEEFRERIKDYEYVQELSKSLKNASVNYSVGGNVNMTFTKFCNMDIGFARIIVDRQFDKLGEYFKSREYYDSHALKYAMENQKFVLHEEE